MRKINIAVFISFCVILFSSNNLYSQLDFHMDFLEKNYNKNRFCTVPLEKLKVSNVIEMLEKLDKEFHRDFNYTEVGRSIQNRPIFLVRMGTGKTNMLLWSQMHGDEPTATAALFDIFYYLLKNKESVFVQDILKNVKILAVPMLNPDGAEKFKRRNAQDIDVNRDARHLQTPEGKLLNNLRLKYKPDFGFNLHDQNSRRTVGSSNKLAAIALMAPPFDKADNDNPVRIKAKKVVSVIHNALGPYIYGHISKYDADYMPRAFGDAMQNWGISTILIESGGWYKDRNDFLQKMNFIAILTAFHTIATEKYQEANPAIYESLPENDKDIFDLMIKNAMVINGTENVSFLTDVAINYGSDSLGRIVDIGDLQYFAAKETIDAENKILAPGFGIVINTEKIDISAISGILEKNFHQGYTTQLLKIKDSGFKQIKKIGKTLDKRGIPVNIGMIVNLSNDDNSVQDTLALLGYLKTKSIGVITERKDDKTSIERYTKKPVLLSSDIKEKQSFKQTTPQNVKTVTSDFYSKWKINRRGYIRRGAIADLLFISKNEHDEHRVESIFIKGHRVFLNGDSKNPDVKGESWY